MSRASFILAYIDNILQTIHTQIQAHQPISITIANRHHSSLSGIRVLNFPGRSPFDAFHFSSFIKILDIIRDCVSTGVIATKRDIYYRHVPLFRSQRVVDQLIDDLCATLDVNRSDLCVVAAAKGLIAGGISWKMQNGTRRNCDMAEGGVLIPPITSIEDIRLGDEVEYILVVEKEAVLKTLCELTSEVIKKCVLLTGKGYPDAATRELCSRLSHQRRGKMLAIVDYDPHGIEIYQTYKYGSRSMAHEVETLSAERLEWLGLRLRDFTGTDVDGHRYTHDDDKLLELTERDRKKAAAMLKKSIDSEIRYVE